MAGEALREGLFDCGGNKVVYRRSLSYFCFKSRSPSTSYAAETAWNLATTSASRPALRSGWNSRASLWYDLRS